MISFLIRDQHDYHIIPNFYVLFNIILKKIRIRIYICRILCIQSEEKIGDIPQNRCVFLFLMI